MARRSGKSDRGHGTTGVSGAGQGKSLKRGGTGRNHAKEVAGDIGMETGAAIGGTKTGAEAETDAEGIMVGNRYIPCPYSSTTKSSIR